VIGRGELPQKCVLVIRPGDSLGAATLLDDRSTLKNKSLKKSTPVLVPGVKPILACRQMDHAIIAALAMRAGRAKTVFPWRPVAGRECRLAALHLRPPASSCHVRARGRMAAAPTARSPASPRRVFRKQLDDYSEGTRDIRLDEKFRESTQPVQRSKFARVAYAAMSARVAPAVQQPEPVV